MEGEDAEGVGGVGGGDGCEEVGCWGVEFGGEDCGPPLAEGGGVGEELRWLLGRCSCCIYAVGLGCLEGLTLRMYGLVGWNDLGTMVVREGMSSEVACRTVNDLAGRSIMAVVLRCYRSVAKE